VWHKTCPPSPRHDRKAHVANLINRMNSTVRPGGEYERMNRMAIVVRVLARRTVRGAFVGVQQEHHVT
jgi:hypothetical protein